jgi:hypothetical protein
MENGKKEKDLNGSVEMLQIELVKLIAFKFYKKILLLLMGAASCCN